MTGAYFRRAFYRLVLPECGADSFIGFGTIISHSTARIGRGVYVGSYCVLGDVTLERDVLVGSHVSIINGNRQHGVERLDVPVRDQPGTYPRVTIGRDTWIGDRAIVMFNVGRQAIVGAGSVVTKCVEDLSIVGGNPARVLGSREMFALPTTARKPSQTSTETTPAFTDIKSVDGDICQAPANVDVDRATRQPEAGIVRR